MEKYFCAQKQQVEQKKIEAFTARKSVFATGKKIKNNQADNEKGEAD